MSISGLSIRLDSRTSVERFALAVDDRAWFTNGDGLIRRSETGEKRPTKSRALVPEKQSERTALGFLDQAVRSGGSFVLAVAVARSFSAEIFGAFSMAFAWYVVAIGISQALVSEPHLARTGSEAASRDAAAVQGERSAMVAALGVGAVFAVAAILVGLTQAGGSRAAMLAIAPFLPALVLQDFFRAVFIARGRPGQALTNDLAWFGLQITALGIVIAAGWGLTALIASWALSGALASGYAVVQSRQWPSFGNLRNWWPETWVLARPYLLEHVASAISAHGVTYALGLIIGLDAVAGFRGAQVLFGPINVMILASRFVVVPELIRRGVREGSPPSAFLYHSISGVSGLAVAVWTGLLLATPQSWGAAILGATWSAATPVLPALGLHNVLLALGLGPLLVFRSMQWWRRSLGPRLIIALSTAVLGLVGGSTGGPVLAGYGLSAGSLLGLIAWNFERRRASTQFGQTRRKA